MFRRTNVCALTTEIPCWWRENLSGIRWYSNSDIILLFSLLFSNERKGNENAMNLIWKQTLFVEHFLLDKKKKKTNFSWNLILLKLVGKRTKKNSNKAGEQKLEHILHWEPKDYHIDYVISMELPCRWGTDVPSASLPWRQKGAGRDRFLWKCWLQNYTPFLNCIKPLFQGETKCKAINTKINLLFSCK